MKIIFTICSNNYLAQAKILGDSVLEFNPEYKFVIGLCDEFSELIDYNDFQKFEIIKVKDIDIARPDIFKRYDIVELNTSIKPSFFKYLIKKNKDLEVIMYLDPDIRLFNKLTQLESYLKTNDIVLTPHILNPMEVDDLVPNENLFLVYGIYNLGFIAVNPSGNEISKFLNWWEKKTLNVGYNNTSRGFFVDQLWINHVPIFFNNVKVLKEQGYNVAPWNFHERNSIVKSGDKYIMDDKSELVFIHFSSVNIKEPDKLSKGYDRLSTIEISSGIRQLYENYFAELYKNKHSEYSKVVCVYNNVKKPSMRSRIKTVLQKFIRF